MEKKMVCSPARDSKEVDECEGLVIDILRDPPEWPECCIYRVPKQLRKVNKEAYTPKLVSIGPFHRRNDDLKDMEKHKLRYLMHFLERENQKSKEEDLRKIIEDKRVKISHSYSEDCGLESGEFVQMILLDAVFLIELFLKDKEKRNNVEDEKRNNVEDDYILRKPWLEIGIRDDLILLENQLPFFVLEDLYIAAFCELSQHQEGQEIEKHKGDLLKLSQDYFDCNNEKQMSNIRGEIKHFTDLVRYFYYSTELQRTGPLNHLCSATELDEAGLKFKVKGRRLLDITFPENKFLKYCPCFNLSWLLACLPCLKCFPCLEGMERLLEVSRFEVDDSTECRLRNLMAFEQCHYPFNAYVCNYVSLLDDLINNEKDVALLVDKKVIVNHLGSNTEVATLINKLCTEIVFDGSCYWALCEDIDNYRVNPWNRIMATMKRVYFGDFWRGAATVVGLVVLVFTLWSFIAPLVSTTTTLRLGDFFQFFF